MNAPLSRDLPEHIRTALDTVTLDDKYALDYGRAFMSGVQALVKLPMLQRVRDQRLGKNTAGFISGYRGSPLGTYDQSLVKAEKYLKAHHIHFQPGVNEELAATALWGTQQLGFAPPGSNKYDGVFGIWYGKGPGVDRCSDVFKHANMAGTTPWGGVIAVAGDAIDAQGIDELVAGVKADVAVLIYGDDLELLARADALGEPAHVFEEHRLPLPVGPHH